MSAPFDRIFLGDVVTSSEVLNGGDVDICTLLDARGLPPTLMAASGAGRSVRPHGLWPKLVPERIECDLHQAPTEDIPEVRWSPYHGRHMRAGVARHRALATPGTDRFVRRQST